MSYTNTKNRIRLGAIALGVAIAIAAGGASPGDAAPDSPPPWAQCAYADLPPAADLGAILSPYDEPSAEVIAVLHGKVQVGSDCSIYDPMLP